MRRDMASLELKKKAIAKVCGNLLRFVRVAAHNDLSGMFKLDQAFL